MRTNRDFGQTGTHKLLSALSDLGISGDEPKKGREKIYDTE